jgi:outer membrane protein OmpA-like peptidoglycan-associated protein
VERTWGCRSFRLKARSLRGDGLRYLAITVLCFHSALTGPLAAASLNLTSEQVNAIAERRPAELLARGNVKTLGRDNLGALLFNPSLLTNRDAVFAEINTNSFSHDVILYQTLLGIGSKYGNFSVGYSFLDNYKDFLRLNELYDVSFSYSFEIIPGIFAGAGFVSDPSRQAMAFGLTIPLRTNIRIWGNFGILGLTYGGSVHNITLHRTELFTLPATMSHGFTFTLADFKYLQLENNVELSLAADFIKRSFHEGFNLRFFRYFVISGGMYGNQVMQLSTPTYGGGMDIRRGYTQFRLFYSREPGISFPNEVFSVGLSLRFSGMPSPHVTGAISALRISPKNKDGVGDETEFSFIVKDDIRVQRWRLNIMRHTGEIIRTINPTPEELEAGLLAIPTSLKWDGRDDMSEFVPDGLYPSKLIYISDDHQSYYLELSPTVVDNTPPKVTLYAKSDVVQIEHGKDSSYSLDFNFAEKEESDNWYVSARSERNLTVMTWRFTGQNAPNSLTWDLRDSSGRQVAYGRYFIVVEGRDSAGNTMPEISLPLDILVSDFKIILRTPADTISPRKSLFQVDITAEASEKITAWEFNLKNGLNEIIYAEKGTGKPPQKITCKPVSPKGQILADGFYFAQFRANYPEGQTGNSLPLKLEIDSLPPQVEISHTPNLFSPDGDNTDEFIIFKLLSKDHAPAGSWELKITEFENRMTRTFSGESALPDTLRWDGLGDNGNLVESLQQYRYALTVKDRAGNITTLKAGPINVDFLIFNLGNELRVKPFGLLFERAGAKLEKKYFSSLDRIALMCKTRLKDFNLVIEGHADIFGSDELNQKFGEQRARLVYDYLLSKAPERSGRITWKSMGSTQPVTRDPDEGKQRLNRRVEFYFFRQGVVAR